MKLSLNKEYEIEQVSAEKLLLERLQELGFIRGQKFSIVSKSIFGEPFVIKIANAKVALRKKELSSIKVKP